MPASSFFICSLFALRPMLLRKLVDAATPRDAAKVVGPPLPRSAPQRRAPEAEAGPAPEA